MGNLNFRSFCWFEGGKLSHSIFIFAATVPFTLFRVSMVSHFSFAKMVLPNDYDLLNPPPEIGKKKHKLKRLVQPPNSFFMDVKCQGCFNITTVFSHSQIVVVCGNCQTVLCQTASLLVVVLDLPRDVLSGERETREEDSNWFRLNSTFKWEFW